MRRRTGFGVVLAVTGLLSTMACSAEEDAQPAVIGGTGGTGGSGGGGGAETGGTATGGTATGGAGGTSSGGACGTSMPATGSLTLQQSTTDTDPSYTPSQMTIALRILSTVAVSLSDLTVRYWFTPDGATGQVFDVDSWTGGGSVTSSFQADYVEFGFTSGATSAGGQLDLIGRIHTPSWGVSYTLSNDWSYNPSSPYVSADHVTLYVCGQLVFGTEP